MTSRPHAIVIVGGGAGGLELATRLGNKLGRRRKAAVTLIDGKRTHLWKPLLHEIAAGSMDEDVHAIDYLAQAYWHGFVYRAGSMVGLDRARRVVHVAPFIDDEGRQITPGQEVGYDTLVVAIGSQTNDFGTPGVKEHAMALDTADDAARFHRRLVNACIRANTQTEPLAPGAAARRHHRRRRDGHGACRRAAQDDAPARSPSASTASIPTRTSGST